MKGIIKEIIYVIQQLVERGSCKRNKREREREREREEEEEIKREGKLERGDDNQWWWR